MKKKLLRYAMLWHRFLAIGLCLFFGIWFISGIVLMYARMPALTDATRLNHLSPLDLSGLEITPQQAAGGSTPLQQLTLGMYAGRPVYRIFSQDGTWSVVYADDGSRLGKLTPQEAIDVAAEFSGLPRRQLRWIKELTHVDQWTVYPEPDAHPYLPFQVIAGDDGRGTMYYVSSATASVFLVTTRSGRFWAWCGAIPHWWYITALRSNTPLWRIVMISLSGIGIIMALAGIVTGVMRYSPSKRYRFRGGKPSSVPQVGMKRWHYFLGYGFGLFTFTWIFSGLATMDPGHWSPGPIPTLAETQRFAGGPIRTGRFKLDIAKAASILSDCVQAKELELIQVDAKPYYLATQGSNTMALVTAGSNDSSGCIQQIPENELLAASTQLQGTGHIVASTMLDRYDNYYYNQHDFKPLPVLRVMLSNSRKTELYVNPRTGSIEERYTDKSRVERWLYYGLHDLDFPFLNYRRPLWDILVIGLSLGGLVLSLTGIVIAFRYLRRWLLKERRSVGSHDSKAIRVH